MQRLIIIITLILITIACHKKAAPEITRRTSEPALPVSASKAIKPDIAAGKMIFTNRCGRCHGLPEISLYTPQRWDGILVSMIPKARLDDEQGLHLKAYIKEALLK